MKVSWVTSRAASRSWSIPTTTAKTRRWYLSTSSRKASLSPLPASWTRSQSVRSADTRRAPARGNSPQGRPVGPGFEVDEEGYGELRNRLHATSHDIGGALELVLRDLEEKLVVDLEEHLRPEPARLEL